ncbi:hypothetical protein IMG5_003950, partial [Ichthyophthirius multifiliis]
NFFYIQNNKLFFIQVYQQFILILSFNTNFQKFLKTNKFWWYNSIWKFFLNFIAQNFNVKLFAILNNKFPNNISFQLSIKKYIIKKKIRITFKINFINFCDILKSLNIKWLILIFLLQIHTDIIKNTFNIIFFISELIRRPPLQLRQIFNSFIDFIFQNTLKCFRIIINILIKFAIFRIFKRQMINNFQDNFFIFYCLF